MAQIVNSYAAAIDLVDLVKRFDVLEAKIKALT